MSAADEAARLLVDITPGPWSCRNRDWYDHVDEVEEVDILVGDNPEANPYQEIARVQTQDLDLKDENPDDPEMWANARFIAAAPVLMQRLLDENSELADALDMIAERRPEVVEMAKRGAQSQGRLTASESADLDYASDMLDEWLLPEEADNG